MDSTVATTATTYFSTAALTDPKLIWACEVKLTRLAKSTLKKYQDRLAVQLFYKHNKNFKYERCTIELKRVSNRMLVSTLHNQQHKRKQDKVAKSTTKPDRNTVRAYKIQPPNKLREVRQTFPVINENYKTGNDLLNGILKTTRDAIRGIKIPKKPRSPTAAAPVEMNTTGFKRIVLCDPSKKPTEISSCTDKALATNMVKTDTQIDMNITTGSVLEVPELNKSVETSVKGIQTEPEPRKAKKEKKIRIRHEDSDLDILDLGVSDEDDDFDF